MQRPTTHIVFSVLVGAGIDQQPHAVRATFLSSTHQRRPPILRVGFAETNNALTANLKTNRELGQKDF
jgi:hypothetical protein